MAKVSGICSRKKEENHPKKNNIKNRKKKNLQFQKESSGKRFQPENDTAVRKAQFCFAWILTSCGDIGFAVDFVVRLRSEIDKAIG